MDCALGYNRQWRTKMIYAQHFVTICRAFKYCSQRFYKSLIISKADDTMKKETLDRRVKYTKMQLEKAMVALLQDNHISKISVTTLCEMADINRSTFYTHYKDQYDLLEQMSRNAFNNINQYLDMFGDEDETSVSETNLKMILEYLKSNSELFKAFLSENCDIVFQKDLMGLIQVIPIFFNAEMSERTREYITRFMLSGCVSILRQWLLEDMPETTQEITEIILQLVNHGLSNY